MFVLPKIFVKEKCFHMKYIFLQKKLFGKYSSDNFFFENICQIRKMSFQGKYFNLTNKVKMFFFNLALFWRRTEKCFSFQLQTFSFPTRNNHRKIKKIKFFSLHIVKQISKNNIFHIINMHLHPRKTETGSKWKLYFSTRWSMISDVR